MEGTPSHPGINLRSVEMLFALIEEAKFDKSKSYQIKVSMVEVYNEVTTLHIFATPANLVKAIMDD